MKMVIPNHEAVIQLRKCLRLTRKYHLFFCIMGFLLSGYTVFVEIMLERDPGYTALCDFSPGMSCTQAFGSEWGKGFGFVGKIVGENSTLNQPNGVYGVISYPIFAFITRFECMFLANTALLFGIGGILLSAYLAYVLLAILNDLCFVCFSIYMVNFFLFVSSLFYRQRMKSLKEVLKPAPTPQKVEVKKRV